MSSLVVSGGFLRDSKNFTHTKGGFIRDWKNFTYSKVSTSIIIHSLTIRKFVVFHVPLWWSNCMDVLRFIKLGTTKEHVIENLTTTLSGIPARAAKELSGVVCNFITYHSNSCLSALAYNRRIYSDSFVFLNQQMF